MENKKQLANQIKNHGKLETNKHSAATRDLQGEYQTYIMWEGVPQGWSHHREAPLVKSLHVHVLLYSTYLRLLK